MNCSRGHGDRSGKIHNAGLALVLLLRMRRPHDKPPFLRILWLHSKHVLRMRWWLLKKRLLWMRLWMHNNQLLWLKLWLRNKQFLRMWLWLHNNRRLQMRLWLHNKYLLWIWLRLCNKRMLCVRLRRKSWGFTGRHYYRGASAVGEAVLLAHRKPYWWRSATIDPCAAGAARTHHLHWVGE